ncbi:Glycosyltransferase involved in cell wall bisynthesis [Desulfacinum hydrothermale DSM 13146]|uniref:Glycosyltransferase involved in cell wall bisynthesis n=1 Tax=Desulfacinum hydrothermale DSM 13146 TaxID=1121390 RepID=A0A1W1XRW4_9BACT|nr:glycosyltransferase family 4 protein [Desulfacinum hydrothermale]SMC26720.1 Glycosyltransferase involved in cell wall bisynthesis [Desulfacinum hydrothermale DSM 13146]
MHILFLSHYFPPEVNAPASRTYEHARRWVAAGHRVTVLTCVPNHPNGVPYPGYRNRPWQWEERDGVRILRVGTYLGPNKGFWRRTANYLSYLFSAVLFCPLVRDVDVVVSTSPQFFCGMAGFFVARLKRLPWVLEIRDLWPESIIAVGALTHRRIIGLLEAVESFLYRKADHIVSVTHSFTTHLKERGARPDRITVITNGADLARYQPMEKENGVRSSLKLHGKFVASYIGTHGMAHGLDVILDAARLIRQRKDMVFLLVGDGAERERLLARKEEEGLDNVIMLGQQPKETMPQFLAASDVCLVLLKKKDLFRSVIPSKIFEAMAMERPVVLGVEGESRRIVESAGCGVAIEPESAEELTGCLLRLAAEPETGQQMGRRGRRSVKRQYNRDVQARCYLETLAKTIQRSQQGTKAQRPGSSV